MLPHLVGHGVGHHDAADDDDQDEVERVHEAGAPGLADLGPTAGGAASVPAAAGQLGGSTERLLRASPLQTCGAQASTGKLLPFPSVLPQDMCEHPSVCLSAADLQSPGLHGRATALPKYPTPGHVWTPECVPLRCRPAEPGPPRASYRPSQVPCPRTRVDTRMCEQSCRQHWSDVVFDKHGEAWEMSNS